MSAGEASKPIEEEIKLLARGPVGPETVAEAARQAGFHVNAAGRAEQCDIYLDTERGDLARRRAGLRVREKADSRLITWKSRGESDGAVMRRPEIEQRWRRKTPPRAASELPDAIRDEVEPLTYSRRLLETVRITTDRASFLIQDPASGATAELVIDLVQPSLDGNAGEPFAEVELETLEGPGDGWLSLAEQLRREFELAPSGMSKLERSLAGAGLAATASDETEALDADTPLQCAAALCFSRHFERLRDNEPGTRRQDHVECLHDMRVSSRRLRAAFKRFAPAFRQGTLTRFNELMRTTGRVLGPARDLDVFGESLDTLARDIPPALRSELAPFQALLERERISEQQRLLAWLRSPRRLAAYEKFETFVERRLHDRRTCSLPVGMVAPELVLRAARRVYKLGRTIEPDSPPDKLHKLRIRMKHLRYVMEDFTDLYGSKLKGFIKASKSLQNALGAYNDVEVQLASLDAWTQRLGAELPSRSVMAVGSLVGVLSARREQTRAAFAEAWAEFDRKKVRGALLDAVQRRL